MEKLKEVKQMKDQMGELTKRNKAIINLLNVFIMMKALTLLKILTYKP